MKKTLLSVFGIASLGMLSAQTIVSTTPSNRNVVLEEFTGIHCTYCPDGHKKANQLSDANPNRVVLVNIHTGGYATPGAGEPDFRTEFGDAIAAQSNLTGYPAGTINRENFSAQGWAMSSGTAMSRGYWTNAAGVVMPEASPMNVAASATIDVQSREMTVLVEVYYTDTAGLDLTDRLNVALLQDEVKGPQTGASSFYPEMIDANGLYTHNHMLRHMFTGQWGEVMTVADGPFFTYTYTYTLPADINGVDLELGNLIVAAYVADDQQYVYTGQYGTITYTGINNTNDVAVADTKIKVSSTCGSTAENVSFNMTNMGSATVTNATIEISVNGTLVSTRTWTGSLNSLQKTLVQLDPIVLSSVPLAEEYVIDINVSQVNGVADENTADNAGNTSLFRPLEGYATLTVTLTTDRYASEVGYTIKKKGGAVILSVAEGSMSDLTSNTTAQFVETIEYDGDACFEVEITDGYGDGMSWTGGEGSGLVIVDAKGNEIVNIPGDSYSDRAASNYFHAEYPAGTEELNNMAISMYPNPSNGLVTLSGLNGNSVINVYDAQGRIVMNERTSNASFEISGLTPGFYSVVVENNGSQSIQKLTVVK